MLPRSVMTQGRIAIGRREQRALRRAGIAQASQRSIPQMLASKNYLLSSLRFDWTDRYPSIAMRKRAVRGDWTRDEVKELKKHSKDKTRVKTILRTRKRTPGAVRQKARSESR